MSIYKIYIHINRHKKLLIKKRKKLEEYAIKLVFFKILYKKNLLKNMKGLKKLLKKKKK